MPTNGNTVLNREYVMDPNLLLLVICAAVALIVASLLFLLRDVSARRRATQDRELGQGEQLLDLASLLPPVETAETKAERESWLGDSWRKPSPTSRRRRPCCWRSSLD